MGDPTGFLTLRQREEQPHRPVAERLQDYKSYYVEPLDKTMVQRQASRCMDCGVPFCQHACPLGNIIPEFNDNVYHDQWEEAVERLHASNNFPDFTGRLCPAPCEGACVLGINQPAVTIEQTEKAISEYAWEHGRIPTVSPQLVTGQRVAVVGSGPAGLAAAQQLTRVGHWVTVFERHEEIGGLLRFGIPDTKLNKAVVDRRVAQMRAEGTEFRTGVYVGGLPKELQDAQAGTSVAHPGPAPVELSIDELLAEFDAVILAIGATQPRDISVPGRDLAGIHQAMDYLPQVNRAVAAGEEPAAVPLSAKGKRVVIIGAGDTSNDCLGTALRQGATDVIQLDINMAPPKTRAASTPWPTYPRMLRISSSNEEGGTRLYQMNSVEFVGENGHVTGVKGYQVVRRPDGFEVVPDSDFELPADMVLLAMGFSGPEQEPLVRSLDAATNPNSTVQRSATFETSRPGVFVAGDAGRGQSLVVWAIAEGRSVAAHVDRYLMGETQLPCPLQSTSMPLR